MLLNDKVRMIKASFDNEAEIESVVQKYSDLLFGSKIIYLPKSKISTVGGKGTIPDGFVIDVQSEEWFIVEAELAVHGTWQHIAPQISKQITAVETSATRDLILKAALDQVRSNKSLREKIVDIGIGELEIHGKLHAILRKPPIIALPIDDIPPDLKDWTQQLKTKVNIWVIQKFVDSNDPQNILYSLPEEITPATISKLGKGKGQITIRTVDSPFQEEGTVAVQNAEAKLDAILQKLDAKPEVKRWYNFVLDEMRKVDPLISTKVGEKQAGWYCPERSFAAWIPCKTAIPVDCFSRGLPLEGTKVSNSKFSPRWAKFTIKSDADAKKAVEILTTSYKRIKEAIKAGEQTSYFSGGQDFSSAKS